MWVGAGSPFSLSWWGVVGDGGEAEVRLGACLYLCKAAFVCVTSFLTSAYMRDNYSL